MATEFLMPKLGLTMESGKILRWLVDDGAEVSEGQPLLVIETDKVESEVESTGHGRIHRTGGVDEEFECGGLIGFFLADGEEPPAGDAPAPGAPVPVAEAGPSEPPVAESAPEPEIDESSRRQFVSPNARRVAAELGIEVQGLVGSGPGGRVVSEDVEAARPVAATPVPVPAPSPPVASGPVPVPAAEASAPRRLPVAGGSGGSGLATMAARQLADLLGVDLVAVPASAPDGRTTKDDVAAHVRARLTAGPIGVESPAPVAPLLQTPTEVVPLTGMRGIIASRRHGSLRDMAQLTLTMDADMRAVIGDRAHRKETGEPVPGVTDYVIAAVAAALVEHPIVNSQVTPDGVALLPAVNVGMAVALDGGLMAPVVRNTPDRSLEDLSVETTRLAEATRSGKLQLDDLEGGTFSVTALGMYGVDGFTPVINPPNTAILGVGRIRDEVEWSDEGIRRAPVMTLSLTWDHRAFDGAPAAEFVRSVCERLRQPEALR